MVQETAVKYKSKLISNLPVILLILTTFLVNIAHGQETFLASSVFVNDATVSKQTTLGFQLFLNTQRVQNTDQLYIILPTGVTFRTSTTPSCSATSVTVSACTILNSTAARLTFTTSGSWSSLEGSISNFINPDSVRTISGIQLTIYQGSTTTIKASTQAASLSNFQPATLTAVFASSSVVVGQNNVQLIVTVTPTTLLKARGLVIIGIPSYYTNSGSNYMIGSNTPTCSGDMTSKTITVNSCTFSGASLQLTVSYTISDLADTTTALKITISSFKNPISTQAKSGFTVLTQDSNGFLIEQSNTLSLSGITTASTFSSYTLSLVDSQSVQTYTGIQLRLSLSVPVEQNCFMKITFPSDFTLDDKLTSVIGTGFFRPSATSSIVQMISSDLSNRILVIPACQYQFGPDQTGILTFNQIKNPYQVKATGHILIQLAKDSSFTVNIAQVIDAQAFSVPASTFLSGTVTNILVKAVDSNVIQTYTNYSITFTPQNSLLLNRTQIVITFPSLIPLPTSSCLITDRSSQFSLTSMNCAFSGQVVTITNAFDVTFTGGAPLMLNISKGMNPQSERDAGVFTIQTYIRQSGVYYLVDSGTSSTGMIIPKGGQITKAKDIEVVSATTYLNDQTYKFYLNMVHKLPQNGYLNFTLPSELSISSSSLVTNNCVNLDNKKSMNCQAIGTNSVLITIDSRAFTDGIAIGSVFSFSVQGIKNPRTTQTTSIFYFYSYDSDSYKIDSSGQYDYFTATMTSLSDLTAITIDKSNNTNNAVTNYFFTLTPNSPILQNDQISIKFPPEIKLPDANLLACDGDGTYLLTVICSKASTDVLTVMFSKINAISAGRQFKLTVYNVQNSISTKPSSPFTDIIISTTTGYGVSRYSKLDLTTTTSTSSDIWNRKLTQSNKNPNEQATFTIRFTTANSLPPTTAILITAPSIISLNQNSSTCYVALTQVYQGVCSINQQLIRIENAFSSLNFNYVGEVSIVFIATNPGDNSNLQSILLRLYTDNTYTYRINKIETGLTPTLECNYPCRRCDQNNPDFCTDCFSDSAFPQYIQKQSDGSQTCAYQCSGGYTSNGSKSPKSCSLCDSKCADCYQKDKVGDVSKCTECSSAYPFFFSPGITCQTQCFEGQYQCKTKECCNCQLPCRTCESSTLCRTCFQNSDKPLLWIDKCVDKCPTGFTKVGFDCVKCTSPCATCGEGTPTVCLTCDGKQGKQLLFGRNCLSECPSGTTAQISNITQSRCVGCVSGCLQCDSIDNSLCLRCASGLALFEHQCLTECPFNYIKSRDGLACEIRTYLLDSSLIYFPFGCCAVIALMISFTAFIVSKKRSLIISNAVAMLGLIEWAAVVYQIYYAYNYQINYTIITVSTFIILCLLYALNLAFAIYYCARIQHSDIAFNYWRQKYFCTTIFVLFFTVLINFKIFRFLYSRFFGLELFSANIDNKTDFIKKIQIFSFVSIFTFTLPIVAIDVLVLYYLQWGSQLYITCAESGGIALIGALMMIFDNCCMCSRLSYQDEKALAKAKRQTKLTYKQLDLSKSRDQLVMGEMEDEESKIQVQDREEALRNILSQIKLNRELFNNDRIDQLLKTQQSNHTTEEHIENKFLRRVNSMQNIPVYIPNDMLGRDERKNQSLDSSLLEANQQNKQRYPQNIMSEISPRSVNKRNRLGKREKFVEKLQLDYKFDNVYVDVKDPPPPPPPPVVIQEKPVMFDSEMQTDQLSNNKSKSSFKSIPQRENSIRAADNSQAQNSIESYNDQISYKRLKKKRQRGKSKNPYYTQINEEDDEEQLSLGDDADTQREFLKTAYEREDEDDSDFDNINRKKRSSYGGLVGKGAVSGGTIGVKSLKSVKSIKTLKSLEKLLSDKSIRSRSSKHNQSFSQQQILSMQSEKQLLSHFQRLDLLQSQYETEYFNQRTFNINDILGDFVRSPFKGGILNKKDQVISNNLRDMKGRPVNRRGYLVDENVGCVISKYNLNLMFKREDLQIDRDEQEGGGDIPMPYKLEKHNFNPHEIMGNFDYDTTKDSIKPIILKNKQGQLVDKHLRQVNPSGFLIDEFENIVDNFGKVKFVREQLSNLGDIPPLFNYKGKQFDIRNIIGIFNRDSITKQIILQTDPYESTIQVDKLGRRVNSNGYLVDRMGNIINKEGNIVFFKSQLLFTEPPKFFPFTKFKLEWIIGNLIFDNMTGFPHFEPEQVYEEQFSGKVTLFDMDGRRVNRLGYLIDENGNIIDRKGNQVFKKEILVLDDIKKPNQVPKLFRSNLLYSRENYELILQQRNQMQNQQEDDNFTRQDNQSQLQDQLEVLQQTSKFSNVLLDQDFDQRQENITPPLMDDEIINISVKQSNPQQSQKSILQQNLASDLLSDQPLQQFIQDQDILDQQQDPLSFIEDGGMSDPEPLMNKVKKLDKKKKQRKQSAYGVRQTKQVRQGEKVMNAYAITRPISSYLPQQYQQRAKSQVRERLNQQNPQSLGATGFNQQYGNKQDMNDYYNGMGNINGSLNNRTTDQKTRLMSSKSNLNMTSHIQSSGGGIFKQNAISALGFTEDFSNKNLNQNFPVKRNQYMISNNDNQSEDQSYNNYLEGDVENNFNFNQNQQQQLMDERLHRRVQQKMIRQNESQVDKLYADEVNKYIDQSDDEDGIEGGIVEGETIFNENFNVGKKHQEDRSNSRKRNSRLSKLRMYKKDIRLDSPGSNDSQLSRKGQAHLYRSKKQLQRMDSKLKNLESIYLQQPIQSVKNQTMKKGLYADTSAKRIPKPAFNGGNSNSNARQFRPMADKYNFESTQANLPRAISPMGGNNDRSSSQLQYGRRRGSDY
eukprot:403375847